MQYTKEMIKILSNKFFKNGANKKEDKPQYSYNMNHNNKTKNRKAKTIEGSHSQKTGGIWPLKNNIDT